MRAPFQTSPIGRRQFAGGALLSLGALLIPSRVHAGVRPIAEDNKPNDDERSAAALREIAALLDRPNARFFGAPQQCHCVRCRAIRRRGIDCAFCGFDGAPVVAPCECRAWRASNIDYARRGLAAIAAGYVPAPGDFTRAHHELNLARSLALPDEQCVAHQHGSRVCPGCSHGVTHCPTCGATGGERSAPIETPALLEVIRELRDVLRSVGR